MIKTIRQQLDDEMPVCVRKWAFRWMARFCFPALVFSFGGLLASELLVRGFASFRWAAENLIWLGFAIPIGVALIQWIEHCRVPRFARVAVAAEKEGKVPCEHCLYILGPEQTRCPECGREVDFQKLVTKWRPWCDRHRKRVNRRTKIVPR